MITKSLDASLLFSIIDLTSQIRLRGDLIYTFAGLTTQQYVILLHLARDPNIPMVRESESGVGMYASELADSLKVSRPGVTNLVKALIQKDLVEQVEDESDRRRKLLLLTERGSRLVTGMEPIRQAANAAFLSQFTEAEKRQFMEYIERCSAYANDQLANPAALRQMYQASVTDSAS